MGCEEVQRRMLESMNGEVRTFIRKEEVSSIEESVGENA